MKIYNEQQLVEELSKIGNKVSSDNNIPLSAFEEIFKDSNKIAHLFTLLRFSDHNNYQSENSDIENKLKNKLRR